MSRPPFFLQWSNNGDVFSKDLHSSAHLLASRPTIKCNCTDREFVLIWYTIDHTLRHPWKWLVLDVKTILKKKVDGFNPPQKLRYQVPWYFWDEKLWYLAFLPWNQRGWRRRKQNWSKQNSWFWFLTKYTCIELNFHYWLTFTQSNCVNSKLFETQILPFKILKIDKQGQTFHSSGKTEITFAIRQKKTILNLI